MSRTGRSRRRNMNSQNDFSGFHEHVKGIDALQNKNVFLLIRHTIKPPARKFRTGGRDAEKPHQE